ncbi:hypothetical protein [Helicobacter sp.]|nr:hypothetical protein [Helicobacter sp.]MCI5968269.1 hypothetical protein [Helicobacter sp.]
MRKYLSDLLSSGSENGGYVPPSCDDFFGFLKEMDKSNKEMIKKNLKKQV